ncbi:MAG: MFS transporter [Candidatus Micrarchaeia archaeon]
MPRNIGAEKTFKFLLYSRAFRSVALIYMGLAFSLYLHALGLNVIKISFVAGATVLFTVFLVLFLGYIGDRRGFKFELILSELISLLGASMIALFTNKYLIIFGMIIVGLSSGAGGMRGAFSPGTNAYIANNFSDEKERIKRYSLLSMVAAFSAIGGSVLFSAVSLLGRFTGTLLAYKYFFAFASALLAVSLIFLTLLVDVEKPKKTTKVMKKKSFKYSMRIIAINSLSGISMGLFMPLLPLWFELSYKVGSFEIGIMFLIVYLFTALGSFISSRIYSKLNPLSTAIYTRVLSAVLLIGLAISPFFVLAAFFYIGRSLIIGLGSPSRTTISIKGVDAEDYGTASSMQGIASRLAQLSSASSGYLMDIYLPLPLFLGAIFQFASGVGYKILLKNSKGKPNTP